MTATVLRRPDIPRNNPFQRLFEFAQPGSKQILTVGDANSWVIGVAAVFASGTDNPLSNPRLHAELTHESCGVEVRRALRIRSPSTWYTGDHRSSTSLFVAGKPSCGPTCFP